jgi:hypothetical protein
MGHTGAIAGTRQSGNCSLRHLDRALPLARVSRWRKRSIGEEKIMTAQQAITHAYRLHEVWIGVNDIRQGRGYDLNRIRASMLQDYRYRRGKPQFAGVAREIRGQLSLLGKVRKALAV